MNEKIMGGAFIIARQIFESKIWVDKPSTWVRIWLYIIGQVNHKANGKFGRGEGFFMFTKEIDRIGNDVTKDMIKKCMVFLRKNEMISTKRSTRGVAIKVLNYDKYQLLDNYQSTTPSTKKALRKHQESTTINKNEKNVKNEKNDNIAETSSAVFSFKDKLEIMKNDKNPVIPIIATYWEYSKLIPPQNQKQFQDKLRRELRAAKPLVNYPIERIKEIMFWLNSKKFFTDIWTMETIFKFIDKDINTLNEKYE